MINKPYYFRKSTKIELQLWLPINLLIRYLTNSKSSPEVLIFTLKDRKYSNDKYAQKAQANISSSVSKTTNESEEKVIFLVIVIDKVINSSTLRIKLFSGSLSRFNKVCKITQIKARRVPKIREKEGMKKNIKASWIGSSRKRLNNRFSSKENIS